MLKGWSRWSFNHTLHSKQLNHTLKKFDQPWKNFGEVEIITSCPKFMLTSYQLTKIAVDQNCSWSKLQLTKIAVAGAVQGLIRKFWLTIPWKFLFDHTFGFLFNEPRPYLENFLIISIPCCKIDMTMAEAWPNFMYAQNTGIWEVPIWRVVSWRLRERLHSHRQCLHQV